MEPYFLGVDRLVQDVGNELVGGALIVPVMVVTQGEIAEFHLLPLKPLNYHSRRSGARFSRMRKIAVRYTVGHERAPSLRRGSRQPVPGRGKAAAGSSCRGGGPEPRSIFRTNARRAGGTGESHRNVG